MNTTINQRFTAFLDGEQLLLKSAIPVLHRKIREAMISTLELFANKGTRWLEKLRAKESSG